MATVIPSISTSKFDASGERRFAQFIEAKLDDDYLCWHNVPIGSSRLHPDFIILHPTRGILVLEVKDWRLSTIRSINPEQATIIVNGEPVRTKNPLEQARNYTLELVKMLQRDPQLVWGEGRNQGKLLFPWTCGVVMTKVTRKEFEQTDLEEVLDPRWIIFKDEMTATADSLEFQERLWGMFPFNARGIMTVPQIERVRWRLFPEIRLPYKQASLFDDLDEPDSPLDIVKVMDLQQEQLARSLGEGHRIVHGVAGSGKTLILGYRAQFLSQVCSRPILVLCYNKVLARRLKQWMESKGISEKVHVETFHAWCIKQLSVYNIRGPANIGDDNQFYEEMVETVIRQVDRGFIPRGQYDAVLIDEGHDFRPEWLKLVVQMVNPHTNSLLVLYDDAQSIYDTKTSGKFSFKSIGIQAQGRTTILRLNYRNTQEILEFAAQFVKQLLTQEEADEDGIPRVAPISAGRHGSKPLLIKLPTLAAEADEIAQQLNLAHEKGIPWNEMAVLYENYQDQQELYRALSAMRIFVAGKKAIRFDNADSKVNLLPIRSSKGLEFPLVAIMGSRIVEQAKTDSAAAKLLYVGMTRATSQLVMTIGK